jgi:hypothetical protein
MSNLADWTCLDAAYRRGLAPDTFERFKIPWGRRVSLLPHILASGLDQLAHLSSSSASAFTIFRGDAPDSLAKR